MDDQFLIENMVLSCLENKEMRSMLSHLCILICSIDLPREYIHFISFPFRKCLSVDSLGNQHKGRLCYAISIVTFITGYKLHII